MTGYSGDSPARSHWPHATSASRGGRAGALRQPGCLTRPGCPRARAGASNASARRGGLTMAVYVDDMNLPATVQNGPRVSHTSEWSHLFADTEEELHAFAARLGLKRVVFPAGQARLVPAL